MCSGVVVPRSATTRAWTDAAARARTGTSTKAQLDDAFTAEASEARTITVTVFVTARRGVP